MVVVVSAERHRLLFLPLVDYLACLPAIVTDRTPLRGMASGSEGDLWWVKFCIAIDDPLAWNVIQEMGHVLNYLSPSERLPTVFKPVSPPPYLNGGPHAYLSWVIECATADMDPATVAEWLDSRLPASADHDAWALE